MIWSVTDIIDYLDEYQGTIVVTAGTAALSLPSFPCDRWGRAVARAKVVAEVLPHMIARREELLEWCRRSDPAERAKDDAATAAGIAAREGGLLADDPQATAAPATLKTPAEAMRADAIERLLRRAAGAVVWWMVCRPKLVMKRADKKRKGIPPEAHFACVEGDTEWTKLPMSQPDKPPKRAKRRRWEQKWTGG